MDKIDIKPLSVNDAWRGRRFKTQAYKTYESNVYYLLPPKINIPNGLLEIHLKFGFSSELSDFDNPIKPFVDILQTKYQFNDKRIKHAVIDVESVSVGNEYIQFEIKKLVKKNDE